MTPLPQPMAVARIPEVWLVLIGSFVLLLPSGLFELTKFDEGVIVTGAMLIQDGALPLRDFFSVYGPGQYYATALLFEIFGANLIVARIAHVAVLAALGAFVLANSLITSGGQRGLAMGTAATFVAVAIIAQPSAGYPAITSALPLMIAALMFSGWAARHQKAQLSIASLLAGLAGLFRWDFGLLGLLALSLSTSVILLPRRHALDVVVKELLMAFLPGFGLMAAAYVPLIALAGAERWYEEVLYYLLFEFRNWRNLEYVRPTYWALLSSWRDADILGFYEASVRLAFAILPFGLSGVGGVLACWRFVKAKTENDTATALVLVLSITCLLLLNQMRVRPSMSQGFPAFVISLPIAVYLLHPVQQWASARWQGRAAVRVVGFVLVAVLGTLALSHSLRSLAGVRIDELIPRAVWVRVPTASTDYRDWADYSNLIRYIGESTLPEEPIFSGVADTSRLVINDALLYFLANRRPAVRFAEMDPGIANTEKGQRELVDALERRNVKTIVLWHQVWKEPNRTAVSNGIHILDEFLRANFEASRRFGAYSVFTRKSRGLESCLE